MAVRSERMPSRENWAKVGQVVWPACWKASRLGQRSWSLRKARSSRSIRVRDHTDVLETRWPTMRLAARREVIAAVLDCVFIKPGKLDIEQRVLVCPRGSAPALLPRAGDHRKPLLQLRWSIRAGSTEYTKAAAGLLPWADARAQIKLSAAPWERQCACEAITLEGSGRRGRPGGRFAVSDVVADSRHGRRARPLPR
jgi:hypothetical protein